MCAFRVLGQCLSRIQQDRDAVPQTLLYDVPVPLPLLQFVRKHQLIRAGDRIGVAVSGGADSVALLRSLIELQSELGCLLSVVHVHHGLRGADADADAAFVESLAAEHKLPFHIRRFDVAALAAKEKLSIEAAGRRARLDYFAELQSQCPLNKIATAHTADDQAETVLLKLLRGAGSRGLSGIYPQSVQPGATLIRPLLDVTRVEVEAYLRELDQPWREDATNRSPEFLRNRVRHELLPTLIRDFNPSLVETLSKTAEIARDEQDYWDDIVRKTLIATRTSHPFLHDVDRFCEFPVALQRRIVIYLAYHPLDFDQVEEARRFILAGNAGEREITRRTCVRVVRDSVGHPSFAIEPNPLYEDPAKGTSFSVELRLPGSVELPVRHHRCLLAMLYAATDLQKMTAAEKRTTAVLDASLSGRTLTIRNWRPGDRYQPFGRGEGKVKDFFKEFHIPAYARATWPVGELDGEIIWVSGLPVAARFATNDAPALVIVETSSLIA